VQIYELAELSLLLVLGTSVWVLVDSTRIGVEKGKIKSFFNMGPIGWCFSCLILWVVAFPAYIAKRVEYLEASETTEDSDLLSQITKLGELTTQGILTQEEFQAKKTELLSRM
jgi:hypothetical protein